MYYIKEAWSGLIVESAVDDQDPTIRIFDTRKLSLLVKDMKLE